MSFANTMVRWLLLAPFGLASGGAMAQDYPSGPVRFVVASAAGSPLDAMMRQVAKQAGDQFGQSTPVENRTGGSGAVAMSYVMSQPADGYNLMTVTGTTTFAFAQGQIPFQPDDFDFIRALQSEPSAVAVRADSDLETLDDFVGRLTEDPSSLSVGGFATAGFHQFVYFRLQEEAGFEAAWVPFEGGNEAAFALLGGHVDAILMTPSSALSQVESGEIRLLGISTEERDEYFPDVPTFREQGYEVVEAIWRGVAARGGTPPEVLERLSATLDDIEESDEWRAFMEANKQSRPGWTAEEFRAQVENEISTRRQFLEAAGYVQ